MYSYEQMRPSLFTDDGQRMFLKIRDHVQALLRVSGAVTLEKAMQGAQGDSWTLIACVDRLVELGELREIEARPALTGQYRIFVKGEQ